ncbi:MAG: hypothetical protein LUQ69_08565, partial [Methanoregulaceae archaeon]|nr:hypothetical protein [Methanoregulaceae archaeon]
GKESYFRFPLQNTTITGLSPIYCVCGSRSFLPEGKQRGTPCPSSSLSGNQEILGLIFHGTSLDGGDASVKDRTHFIFLKKEIEGVNPASWHGMPGI